ncbi:hypothetical protein M422DRAFT_250874 [Sphaerobolus stellatus SS14]|uniref:Unplaced genomic scaffold SPHSTscaffold_36, whole genome shotgun sequence n=1 Tax=Sphaerobolus stellatus (strain SS14) TaxID=990650 RepID=A0A0C9VSR9_SPHS4|nr:hypothetical protein M422DRAFT_250874 [Sphaerobolus stellatus SS14]
MLNGRGMKRSSDLLNTETDFEELNFLGRFNDSLKDEDGELPAGVKGGNWGKKLREGAKFVHRGKLAAWSPYKEDWEIEERARKRLKRILPAEARSPSPPRLPHLRSPSPPLTAPYPPPIMHHLSYSSFVLDPAAQHSFRSKMLSDLERATCGLIEGEAPLRRAIGRLFEVLGDDPEYKLKVQGEERRSSTVTKTEDVENEDGLTEREGSVESDRPSALLDLSANIPKLFVDSDEPQQEEFLQKSLLTLRDLQEDGREYVERLEEIRNGLGWVRSQKQSVWTVVREHALKEIEGNEVL